MSVNVNSGRWLWWWRDVKYTSKERKVKFEIFSNLLYDCAGFECFSFSIRSQFLHPSIRRPIQLNRLAVLFDISTKTQQTNNQLIKTDYWPYGTVAKCLSCQIDESREASNSSHWQISKKKRWSVKSLPFNIVKQVLLFFVFYFYITKQTSESEKW